MRCKTGVGESSDRLAISGQMARGKDKFEIEPQKFDGRWQRDPTNLTSSTSWWAQLCKSCFGICWEQRHQRWGTRTLSRYCWHCSTLAMPYSPTRDSVWLQESRNVPIKRFERVGLHTNTSKTNAMICVLRPRGDLDKEVVHIGLQQDQGRHKYGSGWQP